MKISVVIPAYNEEKLLAACLASVKAAFQTAAPGVDHEMIVCDNNSTDSTAALAAASGAKVVFEPLNQIGRARNTGASAASGDWLLFIDADSRLEPSALKELLAAIETGRVAGGGMRIGFDSVPYRWGNALTAVWNCISLLFKLAAGSFVFCRADAFSQTGGFSRELYAAEELVLSWNIRRWGLKKGLDFVILMGPHISSGRKFDLYTGKEFMILVLGLVFRPWSTLRSSRRLRHFYDGRR